MTNIRTLTTKELQQRLKQGDKLEFWNVQTSPFFAGDLIPGSRRMPLNSLDRDATAVAKDAEIITYCGGPPMPAEHAGRSEADDARLHERSHIQGRPRRMESRWPSDRENAGGHANDLIPRGVPRLSVKPRVPSSIRHAVQQGQVICRIAADRDAVDRWRADGRRSASGRSRT